MTDVVEMINTHSEYDTLMSIASTLDEKAKALRIESANIRKAAKSLQKQLKLAQSSKGRKKKVRDPNAPKRQPAGFAKPTVLSPELCKFLDIDQSTLVARTDVTKKITEYIKEHNLQNPENRREILLDSALKNLLQPPDGVVVNFFTLQTYLKVHFPSNKQNIADAAVADAVVAVPETVSEPVQVKPVQSKSATSDELAKKKLAVKKKLSNPGRSKIVA